MEGKDYRRLLEHLEEPFALFEMMRDENSVWISYTLIDANAAYEKLLGIDLKDVRGMRIERILHTQEPPFMETCKDLAFKGGAKTLKRHFASLGRTFRISLMSYGDGLFAVLMFDLSGQESLKQKMHNLVYRDSLTGLYNRRYYEESLPFFVQDHNFPLTVILMDIDALKLANDAFGHRTGDELLRRFSSLVKSCLKEGGWMARIGGDEFVVLIPRCEEEEAHACVKNLIRSTSKTQVEHVKLSFSYGLATMRKGMVMDAVLKNAENRLYAEKLKTSYEVRRKMLKLVEKTLFDKAPWEKAHVERVRNMCRVFAKALDLSDDETHKLLLAAWYHDIGKIAMPEAVLNKTSELTNIEDLQMQRHPEIGYRILKSMDAYGEIADYVLKHHENVDGSGYPLKLDKKDIPLNSRILRIVEAYDAMVSERPGSMATSHHAAQAELYSKKGKMFDEDLVAIFLHKVVPLDDVLPLLFHSLKIERGEKGIRRITFTDSLNPENDSDPMVDDAYAQISAYLKGERKSFDFPLELEGTAFQRKVYQVVRHIPYGEVWTYGDIAAYLGKPGASRAVGSALNKNPVALAVPCHRVVGANGDLTGFASGIPLKKALLRHENVFDD